MKFDEYKEITVPENAPKALMVELDEVTDEPEFQEELEVDPAKGETRKLYTPKEDRNQRKPIEVTLLEDGEEIEQPAPKKQDDTPLFSKKQHQQKKSRSQARIRELNSQKNELLAMLEQERAEKLNLRKELEESSKTSKEDLKAQLIAQETLLTQQLMDAIKNAEPELTVTIQNELMNVKVKLSELSKEIKQAPVTKPAQEPVQRQEVTQEVPPQVLDWIEEHPEFNTDEVFNGAAMAVNYKLLAEGFDPHTDEFYEELNSRLAPRFPEVFGIEEENDVEYSKVTPSKAKADVKPKRPTQTVSGASRTPQGASPSARKSANTVKLTPDDIAQAERWGWSLERMARRKLHMQKNTREDGYVPINMPDKF